MLLKNVKSSNNSEQQIRLSKEIELQAAKVAADITNERHFMSTDGNFISFDPRYLVFEFTYSIMLRKSQVILVNKFMESLRNNKSMCHQMIMGAGKTTVVTPLLALMLADGTSLVTQVVPHALLDFSRGVMREKFAAVVRKPVFTFQFDRSSPVTRELYLKLCKARDSKAIICATPTSVKSFMLKFVEMMKHLEEQKLGGRKKNEGWSFSLSSIARRFRDSSIVQELKVDPEDLYYCTEIMKLFRTGVLLLDEVDLILHPLKSELNWPIGLKDPIDFSRNKLGVGLRWQLQWHLLDPIFYARTKKMSVNFKDSREALSILDSIMSVIEKGVGSKYIQQTPHLVLLNRPFYHKELKYLMARWQLLYLRNKRLPSVEDKHLLSYMVNGPNKDKAAASAVSVKLNDEYMKMLNLSHDLLNNFVPFMMGKINRVSFGLLSKQDLKTGAEDGASISVTRMLAAIPFVGKDVPSRASQFSHPDVIIGLTTLAYRYEGLRFSDFENCLMELREQLEAEYGPYHKRPAALIYKTWVEEAGGKVRGPREGESKEDESEVGDSADAFLRAPLTGRIGGKGSDEIWPLHLLDLKDEHHMGVTYKLLREVPLVIEYYLDKFVFPLTMEHHHEKISASGQDLGGEMMFGRRVGFSGTPSDLLPEELGQCHFDECVDGQILDYLTSESICSTRLLPATWDAKYLLNEIIKSNPPFHVLIDTGALVTGMSNYEVAKYLINHGLDEQFDGVVFLDHKDRKMILMRHGMNVVRLNQAGIPPHRRFSFYDQIHTTGMDIHQTIDARAVLTLGKDMTFRDYAQGAFRMRGIGKGQTIHVFVIPEVLRLLDDQVKKSSSGANLFKPVVQQNQGNYGSDLLSMNAPNTGLSISSATEGRPLLINIAAWLTVNGMKSENVQFRMLCQQSVDNVTRKRSYETLLRHYKELSQMAFASRIKEFASIASETVANSTGDIATDIDGLFESSQKVFADDIAQIKSVVVASKTPQEKPVGIERLQKSLDILTERIDYVVQNDIPLPRPLSETLRNSVTRRADFFINDYDKAIVEKILMVLVNSEGLATKNMGPATAEDDAEDDKNTDLQKEQTAEEEVLQEQEEEEEEEEVSL